MPVSPIVLTNFTFNIVDNTYTMECDATKDLITNQVSLTTEGRFASNFMIYVKAFASFLPEEFELPQ